MGRAYSNDLRERVLTRVLLGETVRSVAALYSISPSAVVLPGKSRGTFDNVILSGGPYDPICTTTIHG